jgi:hypothetical protein
LAYRCETAGAQKTSDRLMQTLVKALEAQV